MSGEAEPRRSIRATKGQHSKPLDELEPAAAPKRKQTKKGKKAQQERESTQETDEIIRCVCGATEQDEDSGEAWISCETCFAWQHNVCVGVSSYEDEIPENYWCEQCRPEDHKELLEAVERGEKPWEARRKAYEEKKKKGGRKGKGKRNSDGKEEVEKEAARGKRKPSSTPDAVAPTGGKEKKEAVAKGKRKSREDSHDTDGKSTKLRRVSENEAVPVSARVTYTPPDDLEAAITDLPNTRAGPAKALKKSLAHVITALEKNGEFDLAEGDTVDSMSETYAIQIERAVFDTHPASKGQKEYGQQIKSLTFNLKNNPEIFQGLQQGLHSPATLAVMTSEQLASAEMQRQTAEMKAKAEKQSILYTQDSGPRVRRTHKGEEVVEDDSVVYSEVQPPVPGGSRRTRDAPVKRESVELPARPSSQDESSQPQHSPSQSNFDITKVFSSVKSPTAHPRRPSGPALQTSGPGIDADVDRMLQDENESPPYSPTEESTDPDEVWRGSLAMSSIADFQASAKYIGGADFAKIGQWSKLIPKRMTVAGRITEQSAVEYLCGLRYSNLTDIVVVSLTPTSADSRQGFDTLIDYFVKKKRYGVVGDKTVGNVRDTYLVPVPAGEDNHPEFMLNLVDNYIPKVRTEAMLLAVFVYRHEPEQITQAAKATPVPIPQPAGTPTPVGYAQRSSSISGPSFSPATPQGSFPGYPPNGPIQSTTPVPIPQPPHMSRPAPAAPPAPAAQTEAQKAQAQHAGHLVAQEVLGPLIKVPTVQFILPQAYQMSRREWEVIKGIYEKDERARNDLQYLGLLLEKHGAEQKAA